MPNNIILRVKKRLFIKYIWAVGLILILTASVGGANAETVEQTLAFPTAEGFGRYAQGGRGGDVYHVTSLDDDGSVGTLRYGIESVEELGGDPHSNARTIVFDVSGTITLKKKLTIRSDYMTIAGQTAPGGGITLRGRGFNIKASHVIVRYIRSRLGYIPISEAGIKPDEEAQYLKDSEVDAISVVGGTNIIIDHCSVSWSLDETLSNQADDVDLMTLQWSIVSESLNCSAHSKGEHGYGGTIGAYRQSYHHNLFAHHKSRSPKISWRRHTKVDFRNNVIYNWGKNSAYDGTSSHVNWVNNYYKPGPATQANVKSRIFEIYNNPDAPDLKTAGTKFYIDGNYVEGDRTVSRKNWYGVDFKDGASELDNRAFQPFDYPVISQYVPTVSAYNPELDKIVALIRYNNVLKHVGASHARDLVDERVLTDVLSGRASNRVITIDGQTVTGNGLINSQTEVGGWPELDQSQAALLDTDQDGMPDSWEDANNLNKSLADDRNEDLDNDGYTALEEYLNSLVPYDGIRLSL